MALAAYFEAPKHGDDRRNSARRKLRLDTKVGPSGAAVILHDLSATGLLIETSAAIQKGEKIDVEIPGTGPCNALVMWASGRFFGCQFTQPITKGAISAARLRSEILRPVPKPAIENLLPISDFCTEEFEQTSDLRPRTKLAILVALVVGSWASIGLIISLVAA